MLRAGSARFGVCPLRINFGDTWDTEPPEAGTESNGATGARAIGEIGNACGVPTTGHRRCDAILLRRSALRPYTLSATRSRGGRRGLGYVHRPQQHLLSGGLG